MIKNDEYKAVNSESGVITFFTVYRVSSTGTSDTVAFNNMMM